jgi:hypothetical protein
MRSSFRLGAGVASAILLAVWPAGAQGLPTCRVRVVRSEAAEAIAQQAVRQVERWVNVPSRGCLLVPTVDEADVLLELSQYRARTLADGTPAEQWWFIARRLGEPSRRRGTLRYVVTTPLDRGSHAYVAKRLPTMLVDVCLGYLPKAAAEERSGAPSRPAPQRW